MSAEDSIAIANLMAAYCAAADSFPHDPDSARPALATCFTDDFKGDYGFAPMDGPQAIIDFLANAIAANSEWMVHMLGSPRINVDGDEATGDWTIQVNSKRRDGAEMIVVGRYSSKFRRTDDGWRISRIHFSRFE